MGSFIYELIRYCPDFLSILNINCNSKDFYSLEKFALIVGQTITTFELLLENLTSQLNSAVSSISIDIWHQVWLDYELEKSQDYYPDAAFSSFYDDQQTRISDWVTNVLIWERHRNRDKRFDEEFLKDETFMTDNNKQLKTQHFIIRNLYQFSKQKQLFNIKIFNTVLKKHTN